MQIDKDEIQAALDETIKDAEKKYGKEVKFTLINIISLIKMLNPEQPQEQSRLIPLSEWNDHHVYPTVGTLRQYKFYNTRNFIEECLEFGGADGNRILIDEKKFFEWQRKNKKIAN
jgi:hypothetical protein